MSTDPFKPLPGSLAHIAVLAACVLLWAQVALASHETEHLGQVEDETCEICLTVVGVGPPPVAACVAPPVIPAAGCRRCRPCPRTTADAFYRSHPARAPPTPDPALRRFA